MATAEIKRIWDRVIEIGPHPLIRGAGGRLTIHHCHSGSIAQLGIHRGWSQKPSDWLAVCLPAKLHTGKMGIDTGYGVEKWERDFMTQENLLIWTSKKLGINLFKKAGYNITIKEIDHV